METILLGAVTLGALAVPVIALKTGKMPGPGGYLVAKRDKNPVRFWAQLIFYCAIPASLLAIAVGNLAGLSR